MSVAEQKLRKGIWSSGFSNLIRFKIKDLRFKNQDVEVFTTRPDTLFGATFLVLSPEHSAVASILRGEFDVARPRLAKLKSYVEKAKKKTGLSDETLVKSGVFSGLYAINPVNNEKIPVWIADYVLMGYGTGAIMAVPAHDQRDFEFAKKYDLPIRVVIARGPVAPSSRPTSSVASSLRSLDGTPSSRATPREAYSGEGKIINSGEWDGWKTPDSIEKVLAWLEKKGLGKKEANYHLRDWLISRQRYWGPPIPMIYCEDCKWQPVPEKDLPVKLPFIEDYKPLGTGAAPLASHPEFYKTKCPNCKKPAKRETDVSDTFLDSAWYFLRYVSTDIDSTAFDAERVKKWLPVNMYIGGAEHSVLHLLYSRFITMALHDLGYFSFEEPFTRFRAHGLIIKDGAKMSKSKGNVVIPDEYIRKFGADTLRAYLMFSGPFDQGGDFRDSGIEGMSRFLRRVWVLANNVILSNAKDLDSSTTSQNDREKQQMMHKTIKKVTEDIANLSYNTAIAALMEYYNFLSEQKAVTKEEVETYLKLLAPFAPHMTEELFQNVILRAKPEGSHEILRSAQNDNDYLSIHLSEWPKFDPKFLEEDEVVIAVQVNGKLRNVLKVQRLKTKDQKYIEQLARSSAKVYKYLEGKKIIKVIYIEGRIINFVI
ncbi:MAG: leucine--tRNA ligase [Candidatus Levybacteria bacterium]|nr:leucine--tRNA ligase [Candidatus Levybacteria bacterium]